MQLEKDEKKDMKINLTDLLMPMTVHRIDIVMNSVY